MSYNPDASETKRGNLGEEIVRRYYESRGCKVEHMRDSLGIYAVDFKVTPAAADPFFVEVKTYASKEDEFGRHFNITDENYNRATNYANGNCAKLELAFVDPVTGRIYFGDADDLLESVTINGREYPDRINFSPADGSKPAYSFHVNQFDSIPIADDMLAKLRELYVAKFRELYDAPDAQGEVEPLDDSAKVVRTFDFDGKTLDIYHVDGSDKFFVMHRQIFKLIGFAGGSVKHFTASIGTTIYSFRVGNKYMKPNFLDVGTVPDVLKKFRAVNDTPDRRTDKYQRNLNAKRLEEFLRTTVLPTLYGGVIIQTQDELDALFDEFKAKVRALFAKK